MAFSLFPKAVKFYELLAEQNKLMIRAVAVLDDIFANFTDVAAKCKRINEIEGEADLVSREITKQLSLTFITPIDKEDIHELNLVQEEVLDLVKAISTRVGLFGFVSIRDSAKELVRTLRAMVETVGKMLTQLIAGRGVQEANHEVREMKENSEALLLFALGEIYETRGGEQDGLLDIIKWTQIYDRIAQAIHCTAILADTLLGISLKYA